MQAVHQHKVLSEASTGKQAAASWSTHYVHIGRTLVQLIDLNRLPR